MADKQQISSPVISPTVNLNALEHLEALSQDFQACEAYLAKSSTLAQIPDEERTALQAALKRAVRDTVYTHTATRLKTPQINEIIDAIVRRVLKRASIATSNKLPAATFSDLNESYHELVAKISTHAPRNATPAPVVQPTREENKSKKDKNERKERKDEKKAQKSTQTSTASQPMKINRDPPLSSSRVPHHEPSSTQIQQDGHNIREDSGESDHAQVERHGDDASSEVHGLRALSLKQDDGVDIQADNGKTSSNPCKVMVMSL